VNDPHSLHILGRPHSPLTSHMAAVCHLSHQVADSDFIKHDSKGQRILMTHCSTQYDVSKRPGGPSIALLNCWDASSYIRAAAKSTRTTRPLERETIRSPPLTVAWTPLLASMAVIDQNRGCIHFARFAHGNPWVKKRIVATALRRPTLYSICTAWERIRRNPQLSFTNAARSSAARRHASERSLSPMRWCSDSEHTVLADDPGHSKDSKSTSLHRGLFWRIVDGDKETSEDDA